MTHISLSLTFNNLVKPANKKISAEICIPCRISSGTKWPLLAVVRLWPLICLKSPKRQRGGARFYCLSMRKGDRVALAWWIGSNWESEAGIKEPYPAIKLCCSQPSHTQNLPCLCMWVCVCVCLDNREAVLSEWFIHVRQVATTW